MEWWGYLIVFLATLGAAAISVLCSFFNPISGIFLQLAWLPLQVVRRGQQNALGSWNAWFRVSALWPLTITPLIWINAQYLQWGAWGFVGLFAGTGVALAFIILLVQSF